MEEENSTPQGEFNVIPPELQAIVVSFLDSTALAQLMEVNSYWCTLVREEFQRQPVQEIKFQGKDSLSVESPKIEPPWTIEFWIKKEMMCTTCSGILAFCPDRDVIKLEQYNNVKALGVTQFGNTDESFQFQVPLNKDVHLAVVHTGTTITAYLDGEAAGVSKSCQNLPRKYYKMTLPLQRIGYIAPIDDGFNSWIAESGLIGTLKAVAAFDVAISQSRLREHAQTLLSCPSPPSMASQDHEEKEMKATVLHVLFKEGLMLKKPEPGSNKTDNWDEYTIKDCSPQGKKVILRRIIQK